jgi:hypothetical protein
MFRIGELMHRIAWICIGAFLLAGVALGEDFWVKKDYKEWSPEEVKKLLTNSPWSKDVTVTAPAGGGGRRGPASNGIDVESPNTGRGRGGGRSGPAGDAEVNAPGNLEISLNVSWRSALPLRKAIIKSRMGDSSEVPADAQQLLGTEPVEYVVVVSGIPARLARVVQNPDLLNRSSLKIGKREPVPPKNFDFQTRTQSVDVYFFFPRTNPITLEDREVEVDLKLGTMEAKRKFNLKDLVYNGKLEL